nr:hypothetical protein [uncultured Psychroserpens sp.]
MGYLADIYVIVKSRSKQDGINFLNEFLPNRHEVADAYQIPQYAEKSLHQFDTADELMSFLQLNTNYQQSIYWRHSSTNAVNKYAMIFYTSDACMIFGISREAELYGKLDTKHLKMCLAQLKKSLNATIGYIDYENPPAKTYHEFVKQAKNSNMQ